MQVSIKTDWCKSCGICVKFCPTGTLAMNIGEPARVVNIDSCTGCGLCERLCPDLAIQVDTTEKTA